MQPTPVFLPGESHKQGTQLVIAHRIPKRHYRSDLACMHGDSEKIVFLGLGERGGE